MAQYEYPTSETSNGKVNPPMLSEQVAAAGLTCLSLSVQDVAPAGFGMYDGGSIVLVFETDLTDAEKATLDGVVAAHVATPSYTAVFKTTAEVVHDATEAGAGWTDLGGVVTSPDFFMPDLALALARVVGSYRADGAGAELRVVEGQDAEERVVSVVRVLPDTGGAWGLIPGFNTNVPPRAGQWLYRLQGRLNGATSAAVRYTSMSLLELA